LSGSSAQNGGKGKAEGSDGEPESSGYLGSEALPTLNEDRLQMLGTEGTSQFLIYYLPTLLREKSILRTRSPYPISKSEISNNRLGGGGMSPPLVLFFGPHVDDGSLHVSLESKTTGENSLNKKSNIKERESVSGRETGIVHKTPNHESPQQTSTTTPQRRITERHKPDPSPAKKNKPNKPPTKKKKTQTKKAKNHPT